MIQYEEDYLGSKIVVLTEFVDEKWIAYCGRQEGPETWTKSPSVYGATEHEARQKALRDIRIHIDQARRQGQFAHAEEAELNRHLERRRQRAG